MTLHALNALHARRHVIALLLMAATASACGVAAINARHAEQAAKRAVCRAELSALRAVHPFTKNMMIPADPCVAVLIVTRGK